MKSKRKAKIAADAARMQQLVDSSVRFVDEFADKKLFLEWLRDSEAFRLFLLKLVSRLSPKLEIGLETASQSDDESLRLTAAQLPGVSRSPAAIKFLIDRCTNKESAIRYDALMGLCKALPEPKSVQALLEACSDADPLIRKAVAPSLAAVAPGTLEQIARVQSKVSPKPRRRRHSRVKSS